MDGVGTILGYGIQALAGTMDGEDFMIRFGALHIMVAVITDMHLFIAHIDMATAIDTAPDTHITITDITETITQDEA